MRLRKGWGSALQVVEVGPEPVLPGADSGLYFVWQRRNDARWAGVRSRARSCSHRRNLCFFAPEAWNRSFCTCRVPETTNIQPDLQNSGEALHAFVPQTPGSASGAIIQCEWRLHLSSSPPRCSLSLRPLARPRRRERGCLPACRRGMVGPRGREWEQGPRAGEQCLGRAVFGPCPRGPSAPSGKRWAWTRGGQFASTWWMKNPSFGRRGP